MRQEVLRFAFIMLLCLVEYCGTALSISSLSTDHCTKAQTFISKHNETIDTLLEHHHLDSTPYNREEMIPAFVSYSENYLVEPKYNLLTCNIPKVLSTIRIGLFWLLNNQTSYDESNYTLSLGDWNQLFNHLEMARYTLSSAEQLLVPGYTMFLVHREPIERFVSGYIDKCINSKVCYDCNDNITCYIEKQYKRLMLFGNGFRVDTDHDFEDFHFVPQTWLCRLNEVFYNYQQIKYESGNNLENMVDSIVQVLKDACVEEPLLKRIRSEMMEGRTGHTTRGSASRSKYEDEIRNNPATAALLMKMYYYDYVTFGYPLPAIAQ